jgi:glycosyltransferase involved in cell wall biosynthesis
MRIIHVLGHVGRVVHIPDQFGLAGIGNAALQIAAAQVKQGYKVTVCGFSDPYPTGIGTWNGVKIITVPRVRWAKLTTRLDASLLLPLLIQEIRLQPVDVLHVHELGLLHLPFSKIKVMHIHVPFDQKACRSYLWKKANGVICVSNFVREHFVKNSIFPQEYTYTVYNGANAAVLNNSEISSIRSNLGISDNNIMVFFAGAIVYKKGPDVMLKAVHELTLERPELYNKIKVIIAGGKDLWRTKDPSADSYESELHFLSQGLNVTFLGSVSHETVLSLFRACDIPVVPSVFEEPHPLTVCEAMAAGKPVIASDIGGIPETVVDRKTSILFPAGDHTALALGLGELIDNPKLRVKMGNAAIDRSKNFTWELAAEKLDRIYTSLLVR